MEAQYAPVHAVAVLDFDKDGNNDLLLCGNNSRAKLRLGKMDANYGLLLRGNGQGGFSYVRQRESGFRLRGDVRSIVQLDGGVLLFGVNQAAVAAYRIAGRKPI